MENLLKLSMLQGSSACEPVPGLGAGSRACSRSADLCLAGKEQWWTLEMPVASWKRHQATGCKMSLFLSVGVPKTFFHL